MHFDDQKEREMTSDSQETAVSDLRAGRSVADLVRAVVAKAAEEELPFFEDICETYSADPKAALDPQARDELAGFADLSLLSHLITPILLEAVAVLAVDTGKKLVVDTGKKAGKLLSGRRRGKRSAVVDAAVATPDSDQIREVQNKVVQLAIRAQISQDVVERVTLALYVELTGGDPDHPRTAP